LRVSVKLHIFRGNSAHEVVLSGISQSYPIRAFYAFWFWLEKLSRNLPAGSILR
jgi:hypothetical protein